MYINRIKLKLVTQIIYTFGIVRKETLKTHKNMDYIIINVWPDTGISSFLKDQQCVNKNIIKI